MVANHSNEGPSNIGIDPPPGMAGIFKLRAADFYWVRSVERVSALSLPRG